MVSLCFGFGCDLVIIFGWYLVGCVVFFWDGSGFLVVIGNFGGDLLLNILIFSIKLIWVVLL